MIEVLLKLLYIEYALSLKTQNSHWNITGQNFLPLHTLLGEHYKKLQENIDELAEQIRKRGSKVIINFDLIKQYSDIADGAENEDWKTMIKNLVKVHEVVNEQLSDAILNQTGQDQSTKDLLTEFLHFHDKAIWMLKSHLE